MHIVNNKEHIENIVYLLLVTCMKLARLWTLNNRVLVCVMGPVVHSVLVAEPPGGTMRHFW